VVGRFLFARLGDHAVYVRRNYALAMASLLFCLGIGSISCAQVATATDVEASLQKFVDEGQIAGAVGLYYEQGQPAQIEVVGLSDLKSERPMTADTLFGIMSMTKPITATAVMMLAEEGKLALDDPVEKYIPAFAAAKTKSGEPVRGLTIRRLITHTSGLGGDQGTGSSLEATAERLAAQPFDFQPGQRWQYSPGMNVCGRIVEIVSGQSFDEFVASRILRPLSMDNTTFYPTPEQRERIATLYRIDGEHGLAPAERWHGVGQPGSAPNPSGGLFSTADDMSRFYRAILLGGEFNGKRIASEDTVRQMTTVQYPELETGFTPGNGWGLGWCIVREPQGVTEALSPGTFGHGGAYGTQGWVDPVKRRVYVLMIQRSDLPNSDASDIRHEFQNAAAAALEGN
jgi:CubicO group peptidase (beta-lactamase class C family)